MVPKHLFSVGLCMVAVTIFVLQPLEISATLPVVKAKEDAKESKLTKTNAIEKPGKLNPKIVLKGDGKNFVISNTPSRLASKKLGLEKKPLLKTKAIETKRIKPKAAVKSTADIRSNSLAKKRATPKPKPKPDPIPKIQSTLQSLQKKLNRNKIIGAEKFIPESKIVGLIEKQISPIINILKKVTGTNSKVSETSPKEPTKLVRQLQPDSMERLEGIDRSMKHIKNFMNIISQVDDYLKTKATSAIQQLAFIYGGDKLIKPAKSKLPKSKVHRLRHKFF